ncbi:hypothetical protein C7477_1543 [Phyllobacterium leguminum]|uniref:Uncharacterized protein n=1 Tax=Phyllobacterium leguminum TaxID=314237 RepID=A0A318SV54_9HYPH|nr:hypothetical protein C7477_1543 [Phyllobacterium leguminum]
MAGERLAHGLAALEGGNIRRLCRCAFCRDEVFRCIGFEFFELQFHLVDEAGAALRASAILLAPQLGDLELQMCDQSLGGGDDGANLGEFGFGFGCARLRCREIGAQSCNLRSSVIHGGKLSCRPIKSNKNRIIRAIIQPSPASASSADYASRSLREDNQVAPQKPARRSRPG